MKNVFTVVINGLSDSTWLNGMGKLVSVLLVVVLTVACSSNVDSPGTASVSKNTDALYFQLGEKKGIKSIADRFIRKIAKDDSVFGYFSKSNVTHFRQGFVQHICDTAGGPCKYEGDNMKDIHTGMKITEGDFNRVVELLVEAMEEEGISYPVQNSLLSRLAPMRGDIIYH